MSQLSFTHSSEPHLESKKGDIVKSTGKELEELRAELDSTKEKLEEAVERRMTETAAEATKFHAREFQLARLWQLVHKSLGHASKKITNAAVIAGNLHPAIKKIAPDWFWKLQGRERLPPDHLMHL